MSSLSGDENEVTDNVPVRRTRSGRAVKAPLTPKKTPVKKPTSRTRSTRRTTIETESIDDTTISTIVEENIDENSENDMQFEQVIMDKMEENITSTVPFDLDDQVDDEIDEPEYTEIDQETNEEVVPELESPPPPVVINNQPTCTILSTLKTKESQAMDVSSEQVITLDDDNDNGDETMLDSNNVDSSTNNGDSNENENIDGNQEKNINNTTQTQTNTVKNDETKSNEVAPETKMEVEEENVEPTKNNIKMENNSSIDLDDNKKSEPDTEAVSEDELPTEVAAKEPDTEAVSDEELPSAVPADLGETESVSEDELPPDSERKRKNQAKLKNPSTPSKVDGSTKRKLNADGEYDENSPISEVNDETPAKKQALSSDVDNGDDKKDTVDPPPSPKKKVLPELEKYWKAVNEDPSDFTGWTYLLQYVDQENDPEAARDAYNKFLERYPYCYGYWRKYADYEKKKGNPENVQTVFDQGLKAISLSVDLWLHYINHCKVVHDKNEDKLREQYERAIDACGLEFRSDRLWESYIKWELEGKRLSRVTALYDRLLSTPTFGYMSHFQTFQEFVSTNSPNKILTTDDFLELRREVKALLKSDEAAAAAATTTTTTTAAAETTSPSSSPTPPPPTITTDEEEEKVIKKEEQTDDVPPGEESVTNEDTPPTDEETRAIREKIISHRRKIHKANVTDVAARWTYEEGIKRPYFHVKPLERCQLKNWKEYLDYEIEQKNESRIIILFERCLIACALYDEFWLRFVRYLESLDNDNTDKIRDVYTRACKVHHPKKPNLHLQWATFEEGLGDFDKAADILENIDTVMPNMLQVAYRRINLERRRGDLERACTLYENYITNSKNRTIANNIAVKYARFLCKFKNNIDMAVEVLIKATEKDKDNPRLYLQLIDLGLQRNPVNTDEVISYMDMFIDRENADVEQRVLFAQRKVEFLEDFSEDIKQVLKAHEQFQKCIKQLKERKKAKNEEAKVELSPSTRKNSRANEVSTAVPPPPTATSTTNYQYSGTTPANYQSQQFQSGQYANQSGYQQGYQQYPPPSDPNYANYQNWQYSQSAPQAYGAYNQWGSYNYY